MTYHKFTKDGRSFRVPCEPQISCDVAKWEARGWRHVVVDGKGRVIGGDKKPVAAKKAPQKPSPKKAVAPKKKAPPKSLLVSIAMPAHEVAAPFIERAILSCQEQAYTHWELCVAVDGDCPGVIDTLARHAEIDGRVQYQVGPKGGYAVTMNRALAMCRGKIIARLDADDAQHPDRLAAQVAMLDASQPIVSCGMTWIGLADEPMRIWPPIPMKAAEYLGAGCDLCGASVVCLRKVYDAIGCFDTSEPVAYSADADWNMRTLRADLSWGYLNEPWYYQRRHPGQMSVDIGRQQAVAAALRRQYRDA